MSLLDFPDISKRTGQAIALNLLYAVASQGKEQMPQEQAILTDAYAKLVAAIDRLETLEAEAEGRRLLETRSGE